MAFSPQPIETINEIPFHLSYQNKEIVWISMIGLAVSFVLLAFSRLASNNLVVIFGKILYKNSQIEKTIREQFSLGSFSSVILLLNFVLTTSVLMYLTYLHYYSQTNYTLFYYYPIIPIYLFIWPMICYWFIAAITKSKKIFREIQLNNIVLTQISGLLFSIVLLLWAFNAKWSEYFIFSCIGITVLLWIYKIIRGFLFSIHHGVPLYYIILYFCTLEILPLMLAYSVLTRKFGDFWLIV
jgi:uncharacterized membrane protein YeaQ/YmgE (transglycosylase-associated protein family)